MPTEARTLTPIRPTGRVTRVVGHEIEVRGLRLRVGDSLEVAGGGSRLAAEVVSVGDSGARAVVLGETAGIGSDDRVWKAPRAASVPVGAELIGRVVDASGSPMDGGPPLRLDRVPLEGSVPPPLTRQRIDEIFPVGVKVIDLLCTLGKGQRVGIVGGSGVGKSSLLGMIARGASADVNVVAMVGERGREVREFIEDGLGAQGLSRTVVVVATSDESPMVRLRAGLVATRMAEWFADEGADVMLMVDSLTRLAMAQREIGLAAGEPPTARGYTPSVFSLLPRLLERAGPRSAGTVTGIYTVLVEGDDHNDPIADAARGILDGHLVLDRRLATLGRYPAIDPLRSLSRLADGLVGSERTLVARSARSALAAADEVRDLVEVGAYVPGSNPEADRGLALSPDLVSLFRQTPDQLSDFEPSWRELAAIVGRS
ncbi:MAG: FliI/YscN family ATPase [Acidimicrobiia bacterium]